MLANVQHRRFINFAFTNHNFTADLRLVEQDAHHFYRSTIGGIFIATS
ncbi:Uncharacterised protein [Vibrio cholerae]|nr:Uncharacterised protein [Vibrio cholerae]